MSLQFRQLVGAPCTAKWCHRVGYAERLQLDGIRGSLDQVEDVILDALSDGVVNTEYGRFLVVEFRRFRVEILCLGRAGEVSCGKADDVAEPVLDGYHQPVAVEIVDLASLVLVEQTQF